MEENKKAELMKGMFEGATFYKSVVAGVAESGSTVCYEKFDDEKKKIAGVTPFLVGQALKQCEGYVWGYAAYAVAFCVCRDSYDGWTDNATDFERKMGEQGIEIPEGTINSALSRNMFMRYDIDKWEENGVLDRVIKLRDEFKQQVAFAMTNNKLAG